MRDDDTSWRASYQGRRGALFRLAFVTAVLTAATLGLYRFWAKTRVRRYVWSSVSADGDSLEYTGTGVEKLLGFLLAVVILAVYLGIIQMILFYFGLFLFSDPETTARQAARMATFSITFAAVLPLIFFAQYRARRYKLARTRWRGIRFGMARGAWGYVWRALAHWALTLASLGLLLPRQTYWLAKYRTDRSWFGTARFDLGGHWHGLYRAMRQLMIGAAVTAAGAVLLAQAGLQMPGRAALGGAILFAGLVWLMVGGVAYRVQSFAYLARHTVLDGTVRFDADPRTGAVIGTLLGGGLGVALLSALALGLAAAVTGLFWAMTGAVAGDVTDGTGLVAGVGVILMAVFYIGALAVTGGLILVFITQPIAAHLARSVTIRDPGHLATIRQRDRDTGADAEGFADALDIGGAF
ncbi:DUF898 family protein [Roseovarius sp. SYSU LYC5161]|uniref:DUF898 family protein n=1 Tax=Roseovarius halophilus (ex Wu et al. 2025) TaxID=3376060 RepID=UPI00399A1FE2